MIHTLSSREFGHNTSNAKKLAKEAPVFITDRGEPAFVLLNIQQYRDMAGMQKEMSLLALMDSLPNSEKAGDFEITPLQIEIHGEA